MISRVIIVTETHHLLSSKLCEYSLQPVPPQRGRSAAAAGSGTYQGKTNMKFKYDKVFVLHKLWECYIFV